VSRREKREERSAYHLTQQRSSCYCQTREKREDRREEKRGEGRENDNLTEKRSIPFHGISQKKVAAQLLPKKSSLDSQCT